MIGFFNKWDHGWNDLDHHLRLTDSSTENTKFCFKWEALHETLHHPWSVACLSESHVVLQPGAVWYLLKACWYFISNMLLHDDSNVATSITKKTHLYICQGHHRQVLTWWSCAYLQSDTEFLHLHMCVLSDIVWLVFDYTQTQWLHHGMQPLQELYRDSMVPKAKWIIH